MLLLFMRYFRQREVTSELRNTGGNADTGMMGLSGPQDGGVAFSRAVGKRKEKSRQPARCG